MRRFPAVLATLAAAAVLAGCGGSDEDAVRDDLRTYAEAVRDKDGKAACDRIAGLEQAIPAELRQGQDPRRLCERGVDQQGLAQADRTLDQLDDAEITVDGDTARAKVGGEEIPLRREDDTWKLDLVAATRQGAGGQQGGAQGGGAQPSPTATSGAPAPTTATPPTTTDGG